MNGHKHKIRQVLNGIRARRFYMIIHSACPKCGQPAEWVYPAKGYVAIDCNECGLLGGRPWRDLSPRVLDEFYEEEDAT